MTLALVILSVLFLAVNTPPSVWTTLRAWISRIPRPGLPAWNGDSVKNVLSHVTLAALTLVIYIQFFSGVVPPKPPGPTPPVPPPTPVITGDKTIVILYESENETPAFNLMKVGLRTGDNASYLASKNHDLWLFDAQDEDENGTPNEYVRQLLPLNNNLPAIFILDAKDGRPLFNVSLPDSTTASDVMTIIRQHGG